MFCPEGYTSIVDIKENIISMFMLNTGGIFDFFCQKIKVEPLIKEAFDEVMNEDISMGGLGEIEYNCAMFVIKKFISINRNNFLVTISNGNVLKLSKIIFMNCEGGILASGNEEMSAKRFMIRKFSSGWDYPFVAFEGFCIDCRTYDEREDDFKSNAIMRLSNSHTYRHWTPDWEIIRKTLVQLDGLPICIKIPSDGINISKIVDEVIGNKYEERIDKKSSGRPEKKTDILRAYLQIYPNCQNAPTAKEAIQEIERQFNLTCSVPTLVRALREWRDQNPA